MATWLRSRPLAERAALVVASLAALPGTATALTRPTYLVEMVYVGQLGRPFVALTIVALAVAIRLWRRPAPDAVVRRCLALSLLASTVSVTLSQVHDVGSSTLGFDVPLSLGAWLVVEAAVVRMIVDLPGISAPHGMRAASKVISRALVAAGVAVVVLLGLWSGWTAYAVFVLQACVAIEALGVSFGVWAVWRFASPDDHRIEGALRTTVALAAGVGFAAWAVVFLGAWSDLLIGVGAPVLPVICLGLLVADYGIDSQAGRLARILDASATPAELELVLRRELEDPALRLVLRVAGSERFVGIDGRGVDLCGQDRKSAIEVDIDGTVIAVILAGRVISSSTAKRTALIGVAKLAIERAHLQARVLSQMNDIAESRRRLVEAADQGRREVERDLHDGAQQRLAALTLSLRMAATAARSEEVALLAKATAEELHTAVSELQELARGIHPAVLTDAGLAAAVESLAERSPIPVTVRVVDRRYPPAIELTSYFVVAEALTNVTKHAVASGATVTITEDGAWLRVIVADDGRGGIDAGAGSGLLGLHDRVSTLGGRLEVKSSDGGGAIVEATIPLLDVRTADDADS